MEYLVKQSNAWCLKEREVTVVQSGINGLTCRIIFAVRIAATLFPSIVLVLFVVPVPRALMVMIHQMGVIVERGRAFIRPAMCERLDRTYQNGTCPPDQDEQSRELSA